MPESRRSGWTVAAYQWLAGIAAAAIMGFGWLITGPVPIYENAILAGILVLYVVALRVSPRVRRHRATLLEALALVTALWNIRVSAASRFDANHVPTLLMGLFGIGLVFERAERLLAFQIAVLSTLAITLARTEAPPPLDPFALFAACVVVATTSLVAVGGRNRAMHEADEMALVVSRVPNGVVVADAEGYVLWANPGYAKLSGRDAITAVGHRLGDLFDASASAPGDLERLERAIEGARDSMRVQLAHALPDGQRRWVLVDLTPTRDPSGTVASWIAVETDIAEARALADQLLAERLSAEATLHDTEERLRQSLKMEALGRLAGGVAHDFNNLLAVILGYASLISRQLPDEFTRGALREIERAGERAATLTQQLLAFSRQQVLAPRVLQLGDIVRGAEGMLRRVIGEDVELVLDTRERSRTRADPNQVEQILLNLVVNARDAMPTGGRLCLETEDVELDEAYAKAHPDVSPGRHVVLSVSDTGTGMLPEVQARLFEPFFTTKPTGKGTGLGLATVHGIVKQSGGHVNVYSELGHGSTFRVYLPVTDAPMAVAASAPTPRSLAGTETVLLVEDDAQVLHVAGDILAAHGYRVLFAAGPDAALDVLKADVGPVDLLLTDVVMAGMHGTQLASVVRELRPGIRVLYTSGYTLDTIVDRAGVLAPDVAMLPKPFTAESLARKVREVLDAQLPAP